MIPSLLASEVRTAAVEQLQSILASTDDVFRDIVERFVAGEASFVQGPWLSIDMPFRSGGAGADYFPDVPLKFPPYAHQVKAFERLGGPNPKSTLIATGTGSGKTESFLQPIFDYCLKAAAHREPGIKAILIYPMNALAIDQARRIARDVFANDKLRGVVRAGIYADEQPAVPTEDMSEKEIITSREAMRACPPDILLTNYKMLDYLLVRPQDIGLWSSNDPTTLRFLVVDELHTFDGAQGTDLALLIRRLKARLGSGVGHVACVGTSATLGSDGSDQLALYATRIFGEAFGTGSVVTESRVSAPDYLFRYDPTTVTVPNPAELRVALATIQSMPADKTVAELDRLFFGPGSSDVTTLEGKIALGNRLNQHILFHGLVKALDRAPRSYEELAVRLKKNALLAAFADPAIHDVIDGLAALVAHARRSDELTGKILPFLNVRIQVWLREATRMVASVGAEASLRHARDLDTEAARHALPVVTCRHCGTTGWAGLRPVRGQSYHADVRIIQSAFLEGGEDRLKLFFPKTLVRRRRGIRHGAVSTGILCTKCLAFNPHSDPSPEQVKCPTCQAEKSALAVTLYDPVTTSREVDRTCPSCGTRHGLMLFGSRAATLTTEAVATLFSSGYNDDPKLLLFHDSIQDAAHRASVIERRNAATLFRTRAAAFLIANEGVSLEDAMTGFPTSERTRLGPEAYVGTLLPSDLSWRRDYIEMIETGVLPSDSRLPDGLDYRLAFDLYAEASFRSRIGPTLERAGTAILHVSPSDIELVARDVTATWRDALGDGLAPPSQDELTGFLAAVFDHMRETGAILVDPVRAYAWHPPWIATRKILASQGRPGYALPHIGRSGVAPSLPALHAPTSDSLDDVADVSGRSWYCRHVERMVELSLFKTRARDELGAIWLLIFGSAERQGLVERLNRAGRDGVAWGLKPSACYFSTDVTVMRCRDCGSRHLVPRSAAVIWGDAYCTHMGCSGTFSEQGPGGRATYLDGMFRRSRMKRVVAREHTSLLERDERVALENAFIEGKQVWDPNVLSATPTLEMGIDIGDLSTVILCSIPPEQANYVQRIGRTGRRDGNSFNLAIAGGRDQDLWYWAQPEEMIRGNVKTPGVHLGAVAILRRQFAAFTLDRWIVETKPAKDVYGVLKTAFRTLKDGSKSAFPLNWFDYVHGRSEALLNGFLALLPDEVRRDAEIAQRMADYASGSASDGLSFQVAQEIEQAKKEREGYESRLKDVRKAIVELSKSDTSRDEVKEELERLKVDRSALTKLIARIGDTGLLQFMTDRGILPNYAFPEAGVTLKSVIWWGKRDSGTDQDVDAQIYEYPRPAATALSDLAPGAVFYAQGRQVRIDQVDLAVSEPELWRVCDNCSEMVLDATVPPDQARCPKCGSDQWVDAGRKRTLVRLKQVLARTEAKDAPIADDDSRFTRRFDRDVIPSYENNMVNASHGLRRSAVPFGFEYIRQCTFRDVNFGHFSTMPDKAVFAGKQRAGGGFNVCKDCGKVQPDRPRTDGKGVHTARCQFRDEDDADIYRLPVYLYREFDSEAVRILLPTIGGATDDDIKSFVSAFEYGLRRHFGGRVDHLRALVNEQRGGARIRHLYLYDTVPGGTGYLRQIGTNPEIMQQVLAKAVEGMRDCRCNEEPEKNGCHRCIRSHRSWYGPGGAIRDQAVQMFTSVLGEWANLESITSLDDIANEAPVESALEEMFLGTVLDIAKGGPFRKRATASGKPGYVVRLRDSKILWELETQVDMAERFGLDVNTRADFVFRAIGSDDIQPIVVYTDGWAFHAGKITSDLSKRETIRRSGKAHVLSFTWTDLDSSAKQPGYENPFRADPDLIRDAEELVTDRTVLQAGAAMAVRSPVGLLASLLTDGPQAQRDAARALALLAFMSGNQDDDGQLKIAEARFPVGWEAFANAFADPLMSVTAMDGVSITVGLDRTDAEEEKIDPGRLRVLVGLDATGADTPQRAWNGLLRVTNMLGLIDAFDVGCPDSPPPSTYAHPGAGADTASGGDGGWAEVLDLLKYSEHAAVLADISASLRAACMPLPEVGVDLLVGDAVVNEAELAWPTRRIAVTAAPVAATDWTIVTVGDAASNPAALIALLSKD